MIDSPARSKGSGFGLIGVAGLAGCFAIRPAYRHKLYWFTEAAIGATILFLPLMGLRRVA